MATTIGEYLYKIAWSLDKSGAASLKKEGDAAQKSVDGLGKSLDKTEREAKDLTRAADKTAPAVRDVGRASEAARTETDKLNTTANSVTSSLKRMVAGLASIAAVKRAFSAIINTATSMDALANAAAAAGASAAGMARLAYAADLAGVNAGEMDTALKGVRQTAAQAAAGIGAGAKAWKMIGISTRDENGNLKDTAKLIDELGAKFATMDEGRATALGKMLKLTPMVVSALRSGMMDYAKEFDQALGAMTPTFDEAVKAAQRLHAAQSRLTRISTLLWQGIASRFFEPFERAFDTLRKAIITNQAALVRFGAAVIQPLAYMLTGLAESVSVVSNALSVLTAGFDSLGPVAQTAIQALIYGGLAYMMVLRKITMAQIVAAATNPFVLIGAAIVAVLMLLDDFAVAMRGGKSYFDWGPVVEFAKKVREFGKEIVDWFKALPDKIRDGVTAIGQRLHDMWTSTIEWMSAKWDAFVKTITGWMPDSLKRQLGITVEDDVETPDQIRTRAIDSEYNRRVAEDPEQGAGWSTADYQRLRDTIAAEYDAAHPAPATPAPQAAAPAAEVAAQPQPVTVTAETPNVTLSPTIRTDGTAAAETPEIKLPEIKLPEIKLPEIPAPEVTVNVTPQAVKAGDVTVQGSAAQPAPVVPTPAQFAQAVAGMVRPAGSPATAAPAAGGAVDLSKIGSALSSAGAVREAIKSQPLGTTTVTNNNDNSRKYDIPVTVNNQTTVNVQTMDSSAGSIADQVGSAVDASNAKMVRDMQSPLAAIADEPQTSTSE